MKTMEKRSRSSGADDALLAMLSLAIRLLVPREAFHHIVFSEDDEGQ